MIFRPFRRLLPHGRGGQRQRDLDGGRRSDDGPVPPGVPARGGVRRLDVGDGRAPDGRRPLQVPPPLRLGQRHRGGRRARQEVVLRNYLSRKQSWVFLE